MQDSPCAHLRQEDRWAEGHLLVEASAASLQIRKMDWRPHVAKECLQKVALMTDRSSKYHQPEVVQVQEAPRIVLHRLDRWHGQPVWCAHHVGQGRHLDRDLA